MFPIPADSPVGTGGPYVVSLVTGGERAHVAETDKDVVVTHEVNRGTNFSGDATEDVNDIATNALLYDASRVGPLR